MKNCFLIIALFIGFFMSNEAVALHQFRVKSAFPFQDSTAQQVANLDLTRGDQIYNVMDEGPEFQQGNAGLKLYFLENNAINDRNLTGLVYVKFIVQKTGYVSNVSVIKSDNSILNKEAVRLIRAMPKWKPGYDEFGDSVHTHMIIPVSFKYVPARLAKIEALKKELEIKKDTVDSNNPGPPKLNYVETPPAFPAGGFAKSLFVSNQFKLENIKPNHQKIANITVSCIIQTNGKVTAAKVKKGVNKSLDQEALRIVNLMPHWVPARSAGKAVAVAYEISIRFNAILFRKTK